MDGASIAQADLFGDRMLRGDLRAHCFSCCSRINPHFQGQSAREEVRMSMAGGGKDIAATYICCVSEGSWNEGRLMRNFKLFCGRHVIPVTTHLQ